MKRKLLLLFSLASFQLPAQTIGTIQSVPANPTTTDNILILVDCHFTSGGCSAHTQGHSFITANSIGAWALHCLGPLAVLCTHTDTFALGMLAAGNYAFTFQLDEGFGGPPCTPGIVPGPSDSYNFTVSVPTSAEELEGTSFAVYPNPAKEELKINPEASGSELRIDKVEIYNTVGEKILSQEPRANGQQEITINVSGFPTGVYFLQLKTKDKSFGKMFSVER